MQKLNPKYEAVAYQKTNGKSWYNGLLFSFQKRFSAGFQAQVSYTFSKMIDYIDGDTRTTDVGSGGVGIQKNPYDLNAQRALSGYHIANALSINYSYDLPFGRGWTGVAGHLASEWQLTGIVRMQDGQLPAMRGGQSRTQKVRPAAFLALGASSWRLVKGTLAENQAGDLCHPFS